MDDPVFCFVGKDDGRLNEIIFCFFVSLLSLKSNVGISYFVSRLLLKSNGIFFCLFIIIEE